MNSKGEQGRGQKTLQLVSCFLFGRFVLRYSVATIWRSKIVLVIILFCVCIRASAVDRERLAGSICVCVNNPYSACGLG